ncbi:MAG: hypothetical protein FDX02_01615 [Chlorobium sp.]|nr:MAG: hypothetical protein FDX02_01615 [Chlorobium sp.]
MSLKLFLVIASIAVSLAGCVGERYEIVGAGSSCAYKMDRDSGQVWFISPEGERKLRLVP